jgi:DNA-binding CsgD family transcriptional regulator
MKAPSIRKIWSARDELSPRNFRISLLPASLVLLFSIIIGDLRYLDQQLVVLGVDSNNLILMVYGLGFLPIVFAKERHMALLLRVSALTQAALLVLQLFMEPGMSRFGVYLAFHFANGVATACGFYLFAFALNNVERLFTMAAAQLYYGFNYLFWQYEPVSAFFRSFGSVVVTLALVAAVFFIRKMPRRETPSQREPGARESGVTAIIILNLIYYVITLTALYIEYQETTVSSALYGIGGFIAVAVVFVVMLIFNYSALHLWSLCLVCSVLGVGALHYAPVFATGAGSLFYGLGEGLGFMIIYYLQGGALKRSGSFKLLRLCCLFTCLNFVVVSGVFHTFYDNLDAPNLYLAFPAVLVLTLICLLFAPVLHDKLFRTDWTDGYHMADMPLYAEAFKQAERIDRENALGLTPREMEIFTMLLTEASQKQIADTLQVSGNTVKFHSKNLYRKLNIQSRTELFAQYGNRQVAKT